MGNLHGFDQHNLSRVEIRVEDKGVAGDWDDYKKKKREKFWGGRGRGEEKRRGLTEIGGFEAPPRGKCRQWNRRPMVRGSRPPFVGEALVRRVGDAYRPALFLERSGDRWGLEGHFGREPDLLIGESLLYSIPGEEKIQLHEVPFFQRTSNFYFKK